MLTRLLSFAGQVAIQQLVHLEVNVLGELKRRNILQEDKNCKKKKVTTVCKVSFIVITSFQVKCLHEVLILTFLKICKRITVTKMDILNKKNNYNDSAFKCIFYFPCNINQS